jgi:hypothetical protein
MLIEDRGELAHLQFGTLDHAPVGCASPEQGLDHALEIQVAHGRREMVGAPEQPAIDVGPRLRRRRIQPLSRRELGEVLHDRMRFPQEELAVLQHRHAVVGIELQERRLTLLAVLQIDDDELDGHTEFEGGHDGAAGVERERVMIKTHRRTRLACGTEFKDAIRR